VVEIHHTDHQVVEIHDSGALDPPRKVAAELAPTFSERFGRASFGWPFYLGPRRTIEQLSESIMLHCKKKYAALQTSYSSWHLECLY
jgi:hypothetical protein